MAMISLDERAMAVFHAAWPLLPAAKHRAYVTSLTLADLGAKHGSYSPDTGALHLSTRLFRGDTPAQVMMLDINGESPPHTLPCTSRALHTVIHEWLHAIGYTLGLDMSDEWLALSGWVEASDDPQGTSRRWERRPGWPEGASEWRYQTGTWFPRDYSQRSPAEDFADCATHCCLGWDAGMTVPSALAKFQYLRCHLWGETGLRAMAAAVQRWMGHVS